MMKQYGWYLESGDQRIRDTGTDVWKLLQEAVDEVCDDGRIGHIRIGEMIDADPADMLDASDFQDRIDCEEAIDAQWVVEAVGGQYFDLVDDISVDCADGACSHFPNVTGDSAEAAHQKVTAWLNEYVSLEPSQYCMGEDPFPIQYVEGEWVWGMCIPGGWPEIDICTDSAWLWSAGSQEGNATTLAEAMANCEAAIQKDLQPKVEG